MGELYLPLDRFCSLTTRCGPCLFWYICPKFGSDCFEYLLGGVDDQDDIAQYRHHAHQAHGVPIDADPYNPEGAPQDSFLRRCFELNSSALAERLQYDTAQLHR